MSSQIVECPNCGIQGQVGETCFKCNAKLYQSFTRPLYVIDVAHSGEDREDALRKVSQGIEISLSGTSLLPRELSLPRSILPSSTEQKNI